MCTGSDSTVQHCVRRAFGILSINSGLFLSLLLSCFLSPSPSSLLDYPARSPRVQHKNTHYCIARNSSPLNTNTMKTFTFVILAFAAIAFAAPAPVAEPVAVPEPVGEYVSPFFFSSFLLSQVRPVTKRSCQREVSRTLE